MTEADLILEQAINARNEPDEFWIELYNRMQGVLKGDYPEKEKEKLLRLGASEMILMMYEGIINKQKLNK